MNEQDMEEIFDMMTERKHKDNDDNIVNNCCNNPNVVPDGGNYVCSNCGVIKTIGEIDETPEWNNYTDDNCAGQTNRCDAPNHDLLDSSGIFSGIRVNKWNKNAYLLHKLQRTNQYNSKDRSLMKVYAKIDYHCLKHGIVSCIITETKRLYKYVSKKKLSRGAVREALIASCLYYIFYYYNVPRGVSEVAIIFETCEKKINQTNKMLTEYIWDSDEWKCIIYKESHSTDFIGRFISPLNIDSHYLNEIRNVCDRIHVSMLFIEKDASYTSAIAIYYIILKHNLPIQKDHICSACHLSSVTLNKLYKELMNKNIVPAI